MTQTQNITQAQIAMLDRLKATTSPYSPIEYNFKSKTRMLEKLSDMGLAARYVHGGYQITDAGRAAISKAKGA